MEHPSFILSARLSLGGINLSRLASGVLGSFQLAEGVDGAADSVRTLDDEISCYGSFPWGLSSMTLWGSNFLVRLSKTGSLETKKRVPEDSHLHLFRLSEMVEKLTQERQDRFAGVRDKSKKYIGQWMVHECS